MFSKAKDDNEKEQRRHFFTPFSPGEVGVCVLSKCEALVTHFAPPTKCLHSIASVTLLSLCCEKGLNIHEPKCPSRFTPLLMNKLQHQQRGASVESILKPWI